MARSRGLGDVYKRQLPGQMNQQNNFFITASREEIMEKLVGDIKSKVAVQKKIIDIEE
jgi:hypothetical protein